MDDYLSKPVKLNALEEMLLKYCRAAPPEAGTGTVAAAPMVPAPSPSDAEDAVAQAPVLDIEHVIESTDGDVEMIESMIEMTLEDLERQIEELAEATGSEEANLAELAHAVKGASGMVGAARVSAIAAQMEQAAKAGEQEAVVEKAAPLKDEFERFREAVEQTDWQAVV